MILYSRGCVFKFLNICSGHTKVFDRAGAKVIGPKCRGIGLVIAAIEKNLDER